MKARILVVDDEDLIRWGLRERLEEAGHEVVEAATASEAVAEAEQGVDLVLLDFKLPDGDGLSVLRRIKELDADTLVILMTAYSSIESAVEAIKQGAHHYVNKPFNHEEMLLLVERALETTRLRREVKALRATQASTDGFERIIGGSAAMEEVKQLLRKIAVSRGSTVLLTGESGTGKDLAAKAIHVGSDRSGGPFQNITCSALPETLLESELFGHERGAFTDAKERKQGLLELADSGTVFLDEIGEMSPLLQSKLLRFLEDKTFRRVGGRTDIHVDVRVIAATNRDLQEEVSKGAFREDLFYRLQVLPVALPPLRERRGDIPRLTRHFVETFAAEFRRDVRDISPDALRVLEAHAWPGNVRELRNALERAVLLAEGSTLDVDDFAMLKPRSVAPGGIELPPEGLRFEDLERELVAQALRRTGGNQTRAAELVGMNRDQIRYRIEKFGLDKPGTERG